MKLRVENQIILIFTIVVNIWIVSCGVISEIDSSDGLSKNEEIIPVKVIYDETTELVVKSENITQDLISLSKTSNRRKKPQYQEEEDRRKVVIQVNQGSGYRPHCQDPNEEWSVDENCDTECDYQGTHHGDIGHGLFGKTLEEESGEPRYGDNRCRRMVSDVLWEEGHNITRREDLGYPAETMEEYFARTKRNYGHHYSNDYLVVQKDPNYYRPQGRCVCKRNHARLHGRCVPIHECPQLSCDLRTQVYIACALCPKTCANAATYDLQNCGTCSPRCVCKANLVDHGTTCIDPALCAIVTGPTEV